MSADHSRDVELLIASLQQLGRPEAQRAWGRASAPYDHIGAKLADAVLQSGVNYEVFVRPRVQRIAADFPSARTTSGFLALLENEGPSQVLNLKAGRKLRTITELTRFFSGKGVQNPQDLRRWLEAAGNGVLLLTVHGVGPKTVSFLKILVGLDAVAVDVHVLRFVQQAGVQLKAPDAVEIILTEAGRRLGLSGEQVDQLVWRHMSGQSKRSRSVQRWASSPNH